MMGRPCCFGPMPAYRVRNTRQRKSYLSHSKVERKTEEEMRAPQSPLIVNVPLITQKLLMRLHLLKFAPLPSNTTLGT